MDRPCYEKTFTGFDGEIPLMELAVKWLRTQEHIFVKEISYRPSEQDCLVIYYEGFPETDEMMMKYWEQERGCRHPLRKEGD